MKGHQLLQLPQYRQGRVGEVCEPALAPVTQQSGYHLHSFPVTRVYIPSGFASGTLHALLATNHCPAVMYEDSPDLQGAHAKCQQNVKVARQQVCRRDQYEMNYS